MNGKDIEYMREALTLAADAGRAGEIPVGAVVVKDGVIIGRGQNFCERGKGAAAHAEIAAITEASETISDWRLCGCTLYVTLEPCPMCAGAIINSRLSRVVYGAPDPASGALGGLFDLREYPLGPSPAVEGAICLDECKSLLDAFFARRRDEEKGRRRTSGRLKRDFYERHADTVAPELLGKILCRRDPDTSEVIRAKITETECYMGTGDSACHASKGLTDRTRVMWDKGGTVYVYLCYGMHNMLNVVTGKKGEPEAVLIRGTEAFPGPGRVTKSMKIDRKQNGADLCFSDEIWIENSRDPAPEYGCSPRVGIDYAEKTDRERLWRFTVK